MTLTLAREATQLLIQLYDLHDRNCQDKDMMAGLEEQLHALLGQCSLREFDQLSETGIILLGKRLDSWPGCFVFSGRTISVKY